MSRCANCGFRFAEPYRLLLAGTGVRRAFLCRRCFAALTQMGMEWRKA